MRLEASPRKAGKTTNHDPILSVRPTNQRMTTQLDIAERTTKDALMNRMRFPSLSLLPFSAPASSPSDANRTTMPTGEKQPRR